MAIIRYGTQNGRVCRGNPLGSRPGNQCDLSFSFRVFQFCKSFFHILEDLFILLFGYSNFDHHHVENPSFMDIPILTIESFLRWYVTNRSVVECSEMTRMCRYCTHWPTLTTVANWIFDFGHEQTANGPHYKYDSMSHGSRPAYSWVR